MLIKRIALRMACIGLVTLFAGTASAQFLLTGARSGGQLQIGTGLPLPVVEEGIFLGGMTSGTAGPLFFPPLGVLANPAYQYGLSPSQTIMQNQSTTMGGAIALPAGVLSLPAPGTPAPIAVFTTNPAVFQVATSISYAWPAASVTLAPGGAPGPAILPGPGDAGTIAYSGGASAFGGAAQFSLVAGPGASGGRVPPNTAGALPIASVWLNIGGLPTTAMAVAVVGASNNVNLGAPAHRRLLRRKRRCSDRWRPRTAPSA